MERQPSSFRGAVPSIPPPTPPSTHPPPPPPPKLDQLNFRRVGRREEPAGPPLIPGLPADILHMRVKEGSKIRNLLRFAVARVRGSGGGDGGTLRQVVFTGSGRSLTKTITCVEILKRQVGGMHQVSKLCSKTVSEVWESLHEGAPGVTVCRTVPAITILLSKDPLDPQEPGYQPPQRLGTVPEEDGQRPDQAQRGNPRGPCSQHKASGAKRARLKVTDREMPSTSSAGL